MALLAYRESDGVEVESFSIDQTSWNRMKKEPKGTYRMFETGWPAILRRSILGLQHFAHAPGYPGQLPAPESEEHQYAKIAVVKGLRNAGFQAWVERSGTTPGGDRWVADVLCQEADRTIAFEIQLASQTLEEYEQRTAKYLQAGIKCVWIAKGSRYSTLQKALYYKALREGLDTSGRTILTPGLPHMPVFPLRVPEKNELSFETFKVIVFQDSRLGELSLGKFAEGVMKGSLVFTRERQWRWKGESTPELITFRSPEAGKKRAP